MLKNRGARGEKVFITGADGFIGSHLTEFLVNYGCEVRALVQYNSMGYWGWFETVDCKSGIEIVAGDVRDFQCIVKCMINTDAVSILQHLLQFHIHIKHQKVMWIQILKVLLTF